MKSTNDREGLQGFMIWSSSGAGRPGLEDREFPVPRLEELTGGDGLSQPSHPANTERVRPRPQLTLAQILISDTFHALLWTQTRTSQYRQSRDHFLTHQIPLDVCHDVLGDNDLGPGRYCWGVRLRAGLLETRRLHGDASHSPVSSVVPAGQSSSDALKKDDPDLVETLPGGDLVEVAEAGLLGLLTEGLRVLSTVCRVTEY